MKVSQERKFQGAKFLERLLQTPEEPKFHRSECFMEQKFCGSESSLSGLFAPGNESAGERKVCHSGLLPVFAFSYFSLLSLPATTSNSTYLMRSQYYIVLFNINSDLYIYKCSVQNVC